MHGAMLTSGIGDNNIKTPTYDEQMSFETYRLQFEAATKANIKEEWKSGSFSSTRTCASSTSQDTRR